MTQQLERTVVHLVDGVPCYRVRSICRARFAFSFDFGQYEVIASRDGVRVAGYSLEMARIHVVQHNRVMLIAAHVHEQLDAGVAADAVNFEPLIEKGQT